MLKIRNIFSSPLLRSKQVRFITSFQYRHIGLKKRDEQWMKEVKGLVKEAFNLKNPNRLYPKLTLPEPKTERQALIDLKRSFHPDVRIFKQYLGQGYYGTVTPSVIVKNVLLNPKWYTPYTPYQAEIAQGRLESQYNFQELVKGLTGLEVSNASLLDEGSTGGEIISLCHRYHKGKRNRILIADGLHPQVEAVIKTRAEVMGLVVDKELNLDWKQYAGFIFSYPNTSGEIVIPEDIIQIAKQNDVLIASSCDLLALTHLKTPKEIGIDIAFGNAQRLGVPLWYGGPHPAFLASRYDLIRYLPGRIIGKSIDSIGDPCYRIGLQTREQHIKKDKATSNICTSQSLLTNVVSFYGIHHGKDGLRRMAHEIKAKTDWLRRELGGKYGNQMITQNYFDTITLANPMSSEIKEKGYQNGILLRTDGYIMTISLDQTVTNHDLFKLVNLFNGKSTDYDSIPTNWEERELEINNSYLRKDYGEILNDELWSKYIDETSLMRYIQKLSDMDYGLTHGMIPLGSCTMKLNASVQLEPLVWEKVMDVHPMTPRELVFGYHQMIEKLGNYLKEITGFDAVSFQTSSGAMGEFAGLLCIRKYHMENDPQWKRRVCLIPTSAHGTNFASAKLANFDIIKFDDKMSFDDFRALVEKHSERLGALMITFPGTNGVVQSEIEEICDLVHQNGGLVYLDGANMNALVGIVKPAEIGADVCHLNLHKTFCIPHGGGGPGMGPILCNQKLAPYLPTNAIQEVGFDDSKSIGSITSSQWSSAGILAIPFLYIELMGEDGLRKASEVAIYNANYIKEKLDGYYKINDVNKMGCVSHELIIDTSEFAKIGITDKDIAKRLIDYSFHPPTMSWPRPHVIMIEPTESESLEEIDRLVEALISIRGEIEEIKNGTMDIENNPLKNAPHSLKKIFEGEWTHPYSIQKAYYPVDSLKKYKFFPSKNRINDVKGDQEMLKKMT